LSLYLDKYKLILFNDNYFDSLEILSDFVQECDCIIHLAGVNRHNEASEIYNKNIELTDKLISAIKTAGNKPYIIFSSSTQETQDNVYGNAKKEARLKLLNFAKENECGFTGLVIPNVFGPFGRPFYNSVISTFSHQLINNQPPEIDIDAELNLIYVSELIKIIEELIFNDSNAIEELYLVPHTWTIRVRKILEKLTYYNENYIKLGIIPQLNNIFEVNLFNTFRSYIDYKKFFPVKYKVNSDERGTFIETMKLKIGGQVSFSTTKPGVTRGMHFHIRKIERFSIIKGEAEIKIRRIGTDEIISYKLSGDEPAYVDMPIWYTHNITNVGNDELLILFWINEFYNPDDADTYFQKV
ncbi:MAG: NAD-dependent epimerase/dehydratase family protein, partial [Ignavibacteriales bacterium]|nr:NAD-dependent epimerase/dehydratase family protein [Ignavibacteriales bacterium]